jgi:Tfp pilus assembly protein PilF
MSPEQIAGRPRPLDRRTDVYSLGVVLFEAATLARPFEETTREGLFHAILAREAPDARARNPAVSRDLAMIIRNALQKERHHRYATAAALAADLEAVLEGRPVSVHSVPALSRLVRWSRRRPAQAALALVLALAVPGFAGLGGFLLARWPDMERGAAARRADELEAALEEGFRELGERRYARATAAFDRARAADPRSTEAAAGQMLALLRQDRAEEAVAAWERHAAAAGARPELARLRADALRKAGREEEAAAIEPPEGPPASALEAFVLGSRELDAAQAEPRAARRAYELFTRAVLQSERARALYHHGRALATKATRDPAAVRETVEVMESLWPDTLETCFYAGLAWNAVDPGRAESAFRKALALRPGDAHLHNNLGIALREQGRPEAAIEPFRAAVRIDPEYGLAHRNLAMALVEVGEYREAIDSLERALQHGAPRSGWSESVRGSIAEAEKLQRASERLDVLRREGIAAAGDEERLELARVAFQRSLHATSAALYRAALESGAKAAVAQRSSAVCAAACAGCAVGAEAGALDEESRRAWRDQALAWLRADLEDWQARLKARATSPGEVRRNLSWWRRDPHLAPFLDTAAGGRTAAALLAPDEQTAWAALWKSVDEVLASLPAR